MKRGWLLMLLLAISPAYAADDASKIMECMRKNVPTGLRVQEIHLSTTNRAGETKEMKGRLFATREQVVKDQPGLLRAMLLLDEPKKLAGVAYLVRETEDYLRDGMFVYLPSVGRVRRVTGSFADGALMGTDFSYFEFKQLNNAFGDMNTQVIKSTQLDGRTVHELTFVPVKGTETEYTTVRAWIDQKTCMLLKADFVQGDKVKKELTIPVAALHQAGDLWYPSEMTIRDLQGKSSSTLKVDGVTADQALSKRYFDQNSFYMMH